MYVKRPGKETIELIIKSITENTVEDVAVPATRFVPPNSEEVGKAIRKQIIDKCSELGGSKNEKLMALLKEHEPSSNPNKIKDIEKLSQLLEELDEFEKKENK